MRALALATWLVCATAAAQSPARPALFALDDRAVEAWRYAFRTLDYGYPGASRAESMRALGHAAALLEVSARAVAALRVAGATSQADDLEATRQGLAETMCPDVSDPRERILRRGEHARLAAECATTSDLIEALRAYPDDVKRALEALEEEDCALVRRTSASSLRSAMYQMRALAGLLRSVSPPGERNELISELRGAREAAESIAEGRNTYLPSARSLENFFAAPAIARYTAAVERLRDPDAAVRRRAVNEVVAAARAVAASPNPSEVELRAIANAERSLDRALTAWRSAAPEASVVRLMDAARGTADRDDVVDLTLERLRETSAACAR